MSKPGEPAFVFPTHPISSSIPLFNYNPKLNEERPSEKIYEVFCNEKLKVKVPLLKRISDSKGVKSSLKQPLPSVNANSSSGTSLLRIRAEPLKSKNYPSLMDSSIQIPTPNTQNIHESKRTEPVKYEWEESKKALKLFEACQQAVLIGLLVINDYEIEVSKDIKKKKKTFPMLDVLFVRKCENGKAEGCGLNEFISKSMKDSDVSEIDVKRSEYKQRKRNVIINEFMMKLLGKEKCQIEIAKTKTSTSQRNEMSLVVSVVLDMFIKQVTLNQKDILRIGKHVSNVITKMASSPPFIVGFNEKTVVLTSYDEIISNIFIQFFNGSLIQFDDSMKMKYPDALPLATALPFQKSKAEKRYDEKHYDFIRSDSLQFILKTY